MNTHPNPFHNRLDLKLRSLDFTAPECGAINLRTGKPEFCDFECPAITDPSLRPEPHWIADPDAVARRQAELAQGNLQPAGTGAQPPPLPLDSYPESVKPA